ncbi:MAG: T9SS type A sorting domain-containing protein [Bacteroidetes bacterium]|nr:T9SS type A sorting domain-containing protein [Bacteroidota bacterium]
MKKLLLIVTLAIYICHANAQITFQKAYGGTAMDNGNCVRQTFDGGYIITGTTTSFGSGGRDVLVIKTDVYGDTTWTKTFGGATDNEYGYCVQQTSDSGYVVSGVASSFADIAGDVYLIKLTASGDTSWTRTYGGSGYEWGAFVQQTSDGGYIVTGQTPAFGAGGFDAFLLKTDASGNVSWSKSYGGSGLEIGSAVQQTSDDGYILSGQIDSYGAGAGDFYLLKTDNAGNVMWSKAYGEIGEEAAVTVKQTTDGGFVLAGSSETTGTLGKDMCLIKTDSIGTLQWSKLYGGSLIDECYEVIQADDGGYVMCGKSFSFSTAGDYDVYVVKTNSQGVVMWSRTYGASGSSSSNEIGYSIQQSTDGGYVMVGESMFGFGVGIMNLFLIKTDSLGNSGCNEGVPATVTSNFVPQVISPPVLVFYGGSTYGTATIVNSGSIQTNLCLSNSINEIHSGQFVSAFPNPISTQTCLEFYLSETQNISISLVDITGRLVKVIPTDAIQIGINRITIDLTDLNSGIYFGNIKSDEQIQNVKLIRN